MQPALKEHQLKGSTDSFQLLLDCSLSGAGGHSIEAIQKLATQQ